MAAIDFEAIKVMLDPARVVPQWVPDGKRVGKEWVARNPNRQDEKPGSFSVNLHSGEWADFAESAKGARGGDLVSLFAYLNHGGDQVSAARELMRTHGLTLTPDDITKAKAERAARSDETEPIFPVPDTAPDPTFYHPRYGQPTLTHRYYDRLGRTLMYVCRFDPEGERKQILPYTYQRDKEGKARWRWLGIGDRKRFIYGLDLLAAYPDAPVLVVEGEKTADALQGVFGSQIVVVAWLGGAMAAGRVDLKFLKGRVVTLWPDADCHAYPADHAKAGLPLPIHEQPGMAAMLTINAGLADLATSTRMVGYTPGERANGWDGADAVAEGWTAEQIAAYVATMSGDPRVIARGPVVAPPVESPSEAPVEPTPKLALDEVVNKYGYPVLGPNDKPINVIENLEHLLSEYGIRARYNEIAKRHIITIPGRRYSVDNSANCVLTEIKSLCVRNNFPSTALREYVHLIADRGAYNPVADWIGSRPWDGVPRWQAFTETVKVGPDKHQQWLRTALISRWMLSAVAAVFAPAGVIAHGCLVLQGPQGVGKTTWVRRLVPHDLDVVLTGATLDPEKKDSVKLAVSHWLVELGEIGGTFRKADLDRLKAFVTLGVDKLRLPYAAEESEFVRRTVFCASVNESRFLIDETGNRRWWTIPVESVDYQHTFDMQQVWAEALAAYRQGLHWHLSPEEAAALEERNGEHMAVDPFEELVRSRFDFRDGFAVASHKTATDVLVMLGYLQPTRQQTTHASRVLTALCGDARRSTGGRRTFGLPQGRMTPAGERD